MTPGTTDLDEITLPRCPHRITIPSQARGGEQDEEWVEVSHGGERRRLRLHDYAALFETPGLYESLVYRTLRCRSPQRVVRPLVEALAADSETPRSLRVLDLGAGNGIVGELLRRIGAREIVGVDILPEAAEAARRDRPMVYDDYLVTDLSSPEPAVERRLREFAPNCLVTVAALGFGDVPPEAFARAFNLLPGGGWLAMCIKDRFLEEQDDSGFGRLVRRMIVDGSIDVKHRRRYVHRLSIAGEKLFYVALVARKLRARVIPTTS